MKTFRVRKINDKNNTDMSVYRNNTDVDICGKAIIKVYGKREYRLNFAGIQSTVTVQNAFVSTFHISTQPKL